MAGAFYIQGRYYLVEGFVVAERRVHFLPVLLEGFLGKNGMWFMTYTREARRSCSSCTDT
jgi:hypothetical protein